MIAPAIRFDFGGHNDGCGNVIADVATYYFAGAKPSRNHPRLRANVGLARRRRTRDVTIEIQSLSMWIGI